MDNTKITMPYGTWKTVLNVQCAMCNVQCSTCRWHEDFSGACGGGDSEYRADFTGSNFVCDKWEERDNGS